MGFLTGSPSKQSSDSSSYSTSTSGNNAYGTLSNALAPTLGYGAQAGNMIGALLGLPSSSPATPTPAPSVGGTVPTPSPVPSYGTPSVSPGSGSLFPGAQPYSPDVLGDTTGMLGAFNLKPTAADLRASGAGQSGTGPGMPGTETSQSLPLSSSALVPVTGPQAGSALNDFANSAGMDFMRDQGVKSIEASQAGKGMLQSGATGQALESFGQNLSKTYLNDYLSHLMDYAGLGTKNAGVLSGAGNYSNSSGTSSGTSNGTGAKQGLISMMEQSAAQAAAAGA